MHGTSDSPVVTVTQDGDQLIAVRSAHEPDARARMRHEAAVLSQLDHPGIVRLIDHEEGPPAQLRTSFVGPDTWRTRPPEGSAVAGALATVAATIADLHESGLSHGDIRADHVLIDASGRPVLAGLAHAGIAEPSSVAVDVRALVGLGRELARTAGDERQTIEALLTALEAGHDDLRGTVRGLDRRRLPAVASPARVDRRHAIAAAVLVVAAAATLLLRTADSSPNADAAAEPVAQAAETPQPTPTPAPTPPPTTAGPAEDATELVHAGRRYAIGRPGDVVVTGDWDCDGTATPALLRPETGEVAVFAAWPDADASIAPTATTVVEGATDLSLTDEPCPILRATTATGSRLITPLESS